MREAVHGPLPPFEAQVVNRWARLTPTRVVGGTVLAVVVREGSEAEAWRYAVL